MRVILTTNIKKIGKIGDLVEVKNGYARNFLFPNNMALRENKKNLEYYNKKKAVDDNDEAEGSFMSVDAAEKRNVKSSDLKLDETVEDIQEDEFTCSICFLVLKNTQLAKPRAKVCHDCA